MKETIEILAGIVAVIFIFAPHEFAHAFVAYKCGDATAKMAGRLSLNPLKHLDPAGFLLCALTGFGWAKPVPINPTNFRKYRSGLFLTAIAGVAVNYIIAFLAYPLFLTVFLYAHPATEAASYAVMFGYLSFGYIFLFGLSVVVFNLLPFNPLDGFRVVESLTREINPVRRFLKNYGKYILIALVLESFLCDVLQRYTNLPYVQYFDILGFYLQYFARIILGFPITAFWNTVFGLPFNLTLI